MTGVAVDVEPFFSLDKLPLPLCLAEVVDALILDKICRKNCPPLTCTYKQIARVIQMDSRGVISF